MSVIKNNKGKIVLIDGMCGTGKSTTAQILGRQLSLHSLPYRWLHEEIAEHPIRKDEFSIGALNTQEGMNSNIQEMLNRWHLFVERVLASGEIFIIEGCFIHAIDRYFAQSACNIEQTLQYFSKVSDILLKVDTLFVYLRSQNVRKTLGHVFPIRGDWWKELILVPSEEKFFDITELQNEDSVYNSWELFQEISDKVYDIYHGDKIRIDVSVGTWTENPKKVLGFMGLPYIDCPNISINDPERFCGKYISNDSEHQIEIMFDKNMNNLFAKGFWPYMKLIPIAENAFQMESFPITLTFLTNVDNNILFISGEYDWDIVGKTLKKINQKTGQNFI